MMIVVKRSLVPILPLICICMIQNACNRTFNRGLSDKCDKHGASKHVSGLVPERPQDKKMLRLPNGFMLWKDVSTALRSQSHFIRPCIENHCI